MLTGENGILNKGEMAKKKTELEGTKEQIQIQVLASFNENAELSLNTLRSNLKSIGSVVIADNFPATAILNGHSFKINSNGIIENQEKADRTGIKVGDYINFEPDTDYDEEDNPVPKKYSKDYLTEQYTGNKNQEYNSEDLVQNVLKWQVLKIYEDGSLKIVGSPTDNKIRIDGDIGYHNFVWILNDICEQLYGKKSIGIIARNINIEDFEDDDYYVNENKGNWKVAKYNYINEQIAQRKIELDNGSNYIEAVDTVNNTVTYKKNYSYYPNIYQYEIGSGIDTRDVKSNGITQSDKLATSREKLPQRGSVLKSQANSNLTTKYTSYSIDINEQNYGDVYNILKTSDPYTIASRFVECKSDFSAFGNCSVYSGKLYFITRAISMKSRRWCGI